MRESGRDGAVSLRTGFNVSAIAPILIGLSAPVIAFSLLSPQFVAHGRFLLIALMTALLLVATLMFVASLLLDGPLTSVVVDPERRSLVLVHTSPVASKYRAVPFGDIAALRLTYQYDDDGYRYAAPELVLRDGERQLLAIAMSEGEVRAIRAAIGLVT
jgi:hypothetical protein